MISDCFQPKEIKVADKRCGTDTKSDIERYGLGVVISVWKQELMDIIEELDNE